MNYQRIGSVKLQEASRNHLPCLCLYVGEQFRTNSCLFSSLTSPGGEISSLLEHSMSELDPFTVLKIFLDPTGISPALA